MLPSTELRTVQPSPSKVTSCKTSTQAQLDAAKLRLVIAERTSEIAEIQHAVLRAQQEQLEFEQAQLELELLQLEREYSELLQHPASVYTPKRQRAPPPRHVNTRVCQYKYVLSETNTIAAVYWIFPNQLADLKKYGSVLSIDGVNSLNEHDYPVLTPTCLDGDGHIRPVGYCVAFQ